MPMVREFFTRNEINVKLSRMYAKTEITFATTTAIYN